MRFVRYLLLAKVGWLFEFERSTFDVVLGQKVPPL